MKLKCRVIERFRGNYGIEAGRRVFEVSRSVRCAWRNRQGKDAKDQRPADLITDCQQRCKQTVAEYIQLYNLERINLKNGLTPFEIQSKAA